MLIKKLVNVLLISNLVLFSCKSDKNNPLNVINKGIWFPVNGDAVPYIVKGSEIDTETKKTDTLIFSSPPVWFVDEDISKLNTFYIIPHEHRIFQDSVENWRVDFHNKNNNWLLNVNASKDTMTCTLTGKSGVNTVINYQHLLRETTSPYRTLKEVGNKLSGTNWIGENKDGIKEVLAFTEAENIWKDSLADYTSFVISAITYNLRKNQQEGGNHFINIGFYKFQEFIFIDLYSGINESRKYLIKSINKEMNKMVLIPTADNYQFADKEIIWTRPEQRVPLSDSLRSGLLHKVDSLNSF